MNPSSEEALFALALEKPVEKRAAFLDAMCEGDPALRQRLNALLAAHEQPETLLATQAEAAWPTIKLELADAPDEAVGQTLGRYKLLERVGEGGCGVVYVAEQTEPVRRRVALKVIKLGMDTKQVVARFEAERQALAMMEGEELTAPVCSACKITSPIFASVNKRLQRLALRRSRFGQRRDAFIQRGEHTASSEGPVPRKPLHRQIVPGVARPEQAMGTLASRR
jgi:hypothetical protein